MHPDILTPREWEALDLIRQGQSNEQIAQRMGISMDGAKYHVSEILSKLGVSSRQEAASWQPPAARPRWAAGLAPVGWLLQRLTLRTAMTAAGTSVIIAAVGGLAFLGWAVLTTGTADEQSAETPAVASGSGLEGYTKTTFPVVGRAAGWPGVRDMDVAPDGTVWVATYEFPRVEDTAVARFDGETWTTYTAEDGLPRGRVWNVRVAPDGTVWATCARGLARLDGEKWTIVPAPEGFQDLAVAPDGSVVVSGGDRVTRFDGETWTSLFDRTPNQTDGDAIQGFMAAVDVSPVDGTVWMGTQGGGFWGGRGSISWLSGSTWTTVHVDELREGASGVLAILAAPDGSVWLMLDDDVARFDGSTWAVSPIPPSDKPPNRTEHVSADDLAVGPDGTLWVLRPDGLLSFDGNSWTKDRLGKNPAAVDVGADGTVWVATWDRSLVRLTPP